MGFHTLPAKGDRQVSGKRFGEGAGEVQALGGACVALLVEHSLDGTVTRVP